MFKSPQPPLTKGGEGGIFGSWVSPGALGFCGKSALLGKGISLGSLRLACKRTLKMGGVRPP